MLVGRQAEQQAIDRLMAAARLGTGGVLAVTGEAGVGKTALLENAVSGQPGIRVLRATGLESEREIPFATLLQLVRPALGALDGIPPVQATALSAALALPGGHGDDARDRFAIGAAVLSLLCRYAEEEPVAVLVDDLQLADAPSAHALVFAARRLTADPVAALFGVRTPEGDEVVIGLPRLSLEGLDLAATRALLSHVTGGGPSDAQVGLLHRATEGNPLALLELRAADLDVVQSVETGLPLRVPRVVADTFGRRLERLDVDCRAALLVAAVCGTDLRLITAACAAHGIDAARLGDAETAEMVTVQGGRVEFRHPLLRSAVYSGASMQQRHAAHRAAADATPRTDADRRAWHLAEATWHPDQEVADLLAEAGEHAVARAAYAVASGAFERAARLSPEAEDRAERLLRAADAAWIAGDGRRAIALLDERERDASPEAATYDVRESELRASIAARTGSLREALGILLTAADRADDADAATVALADAVHATFYLGDARTAAGLGERLAALRADVTRPRALALGLMATGMARTLAGSGGADDIRAAVPLLETDPELGHDPRRLSWLLLAPLFLRDATSGARLRTLVDDVRNAAGIGALPAVLFHVAVDQSTTDASWPRAEANFGEAIRLASETGQTTELAMSLAGLARLEARAGRVDACRAHGAEARLLCAARDIHVGEVWVGLALGDLELSLGHPDRALAHLSGLAELLERLRLDDVDLSPAPELTDALARLGRRADAASVAAEFRVRADRKGQPWARARAARAMGLAAADDEFDTWFERALDRHAETLDAFEAARTRLAYGERLRRAGRRSDARRPLREALDGFAELGASLWRDRAAAELTATGEHVRAAGDDPVAVLTPQELQVSLLLAEGRTTREAAAALFLSPKTVEYHLRKVYTKLGISSREALSTLLPGADR
ncbi:MULTISPECIES: LuxR family transcriptional regulator [unclassified Microbacterium]|uniref:ATP-binding protein n=1 Tax=unclassified Microbacterium TaxID=2609290 RepID=UPI00214C2FA7|nr:MULTISPECIES: LuxR family transcriptional regulator [unclassified Microbacterium]MCR2808181.1 AAA family ATPase [Microbacterium sp. zg.B185]WIM19354.1 AAA family ATPase [Microbacterium sp. zg-B185]